MTTECHIGKTVLGGEGVKKIVPKGAPCRENKYRFPVQKTTNAN
jgi:hypothetical protein